MPSVFSVMGDSLLDAPGSDLAARCLCFLTKLRNTPLLREAGGIISIKGGIGVFIAGYARNKHPNPDLFEKIQLEEIMLASNAYIAAQDIFYGKSQTVREMYAVLLDEINKLGPVQEIQKAISISFENRKPFASVLIRNRSIKLVLRTQYRIASKRIYSIDRVADKNFDHTIMLSSKSDIDAELMKWLGDAYQSSK